MKKTRMPVVSLVVLALAAFLIDGCEGDGGGGVGGDVGDNDPNLILAMGDSITAGYGLAGGQAYPTQLALMIGRTVINAGVNGERAYEGASRAAGLLARYKPGYVLILYGANDATNGAEPAVTVEYLRAIITAAKTNKTIPIIGTVPPAFGSHDFSELAVEGLNPAILAMTASEGVAVANVNGALQDPALYQSDGLHPNVAGAAKVAAAFAAFF